MTSRQLPPPATAVAVHHRRQSRILLLATIAAFPSVIFLLLVLLFLYLYLSRCRSPTLLFDSPSPSGLRRFSYRELDAATSGFAASRSLGRGASAAVFLGILANGKSVAVKRLELPSDPPAPSSGEREFLNELQMLSNLNRSAFVVSLLGYCFEGNHRRLLVYEYMSNGSLQELFFGPRRPLTDWNRRFQIILDLAKAITFLHLSDPLIIHGDIKPSNVLLGHDFRAKISDFGLSRRKTESAASPVVELFSQGLLSGNQQVDIALPIRPSSSSSSSFLNHEKNVRPMGKEAAVSPCDEELGSLEFKNQRFEEGSLDDRGSHLGANGSIKRDRKVREWWKEEYYEEVSKKEKANKRLKCYNGYHHSHRGDGEFNVNISIRNGRKKKKKKCRSVSDEMSSGEGVRGTVCYIAPECSGCGNLTEKADIYNLGVLILVIISGRRPLHVLESPMKLGRANLISWCRRLAQTGNVLDIVDENLKDSYDKDRVRLCINVALLCLQRMPDVRPDSWDIVKVLEGERELPEVPC